VTTVARWCTRHRIVVLTLWLVGLIAAVVASSAFGSRYDNSFSVPGSGSAKGVTLLREGLPAQAGDQDTIVWRARQGTVRDAGIRTGMTSALTAVSHLPDVAAVVGPYRPGGGTQVSRDGRTAYALVTFTEQADTLPVSRIHAVINTARAAAGPALDVELTGQATDVANRPKLSTTVIVGVVAAAVILAIAFGSLFAMLLPLVTAIFGLGVGLMTVNVLTHAFSIAQLAPNLATLVGLGVGVDYALFIVTRHRRALERGASPREAAIVALNTSGRAVLFAGATVCVAILGMIVLGVSYLNGVAVAVALVVLITVAAAITLLPALLSLLGMRVLSRRQRRALAQPGPARAVPAQRTPARRPAGGFWARWAAFVERRPWPLAAAALLVMAVLAIPVASLRLGHADDGTLPTNLTSRRAYDLLVEGFGPGFTGPLQVVAQPRDAGGEVPVGRLVDAVEHTPGVAGVDVAPRPAGSAVSVLEVYPDSAPDSVRTAHLIGDLRARVLPANAGPSTAVYVTGSTATFHDFATLLSSKLWPFIGVIVALGFVLLMLAFRSIAVPLTAAAMNLLGAAASFGVVVAVFQWGWGLRAAGLGNAAPTESFLPVLMISVLFGLSMDYQVFLVSRMHENWLHSGDNSAAVRGGQAETGRVITAAAAIMISVFLAFALGGQRAIAEFGVGLVAAVALDAFVLRTVLVPAVMHLAGRANWWLPGWLDRRLPHLSVEPGEDTAVLAPREPEATGASVP
jgi:RND superfamily putative drug exporter